MSLSEEAIFKLRILLLSIALTTFQPFPTVQNLIYFSRFFFRKPTSSALSALSRMNFSKTNFFHFLSAEKTFRIKFLVHSTLTGVLFCFVFTLESFFRHTKKRGKAEENFNVFPTHTGATFRRAEILFAAACFFLPFQIVNRFFSGENLICLFRNYSVYFSPHRSARLEFNSITRN